MTADDRHAIEQVLAKLEEIAPPNEDAEIITDEWVAIWWFDVIDSYCRTRERAIVEAEASALTAAPRIIRQLLAAYDRLQQSQEWQPIERYDYEQRDTVLLSDGSTVDIGGWISAADQGAEPEEEFRIAHGWWFLESIDMRPTVYRALPSPPR